MKKLNEILNSWKRLINLLVIAFGIILILFAIILQKCSLASNIFMSIGCSVLATGIVTLITASYIISRNEKKEIIDTWKLEAIFQTKATMNERSNECLDNAKSNIDIIAIGMTNFLNFKKQLLEEKLSKNVQIRIISCDNIKMLEQREIDENVSQVPKHTMKTEVQQLTDWVKALERTHNIKIKYHSTYPGFSYLRIDDNVFWGPNLPLYFSQQNMAFEFSLHGKGGKYLNDYFNQLWNDPKICSEVLHFKE